MEADGYIMEIKQFFTFGYVFEKNVSLKFINQVFLHEVGSVNLGHALKKCKSHCFILFFKVVKIVLSRKERKMSGSLARAK